jgi:EpsG family
MIEYILIFLIPFFFIFLDKENEKPNYWGYFLLLIVASLFSGLRDMIGGYDIFIYGQVYEAPVEGILKYKPFEKGYELYNVFLKNFNNDRQFLFIVTAFLISFLHFRVLKKYSPMLYFSLFLLFCKFYIMSFVYLRQCLAMGIIWFSTPYILKKQYFKVFLILLITFFFHKSSIVLIPLFFISNKKFTNLNFFIIISVVLIIGLSPLSQLIITSMSDSIDDSKISKYASINNEVNLFYLLEILILSGLLLYFKTDFYKKKLGRLILNAVFLYIILNTISLINASFIRFGWYYYIFVILFLTFIYTFIKEKKYKNLYKLLVVIYFGLMFFRVLYYWDGGDMVPYKTIYQDFHRPHLYDHFEYRPRKYSL